MQVLVRALRVLSEVADAADGQSLTDLCKRLDVPVSSMHRILRVLADEGFIRRDPMNLRNYPGPTLLRLTNASRHRNTVAEAVRSYLADLVSRFDETAFAAELLQGRPICVALIEGGRPLHLSIGVGHELPLHAAASARALLAYEDPERISALLAMHDMRAFLPGTPRTVGEVMEHLRLIRERGYDMCENELDANVWAVSAPVRSQGRAAASITVAAPADRLAAEARQEMITAVCEAAAAIETTHVLRIRG